MKSIIAQTANWMVSADPSQLTFYFQSLQGGGEIPFWAGGRYHNLARRLRDAPDAVIEGYVSRRIAALEPAGSGA